MIRVQLTAGLVALFGLGYFALDNLVRSSTVDQAEHGAMANARVLSITGELAFERALSRAKNNVRAAARDLEILPPAVGEGSKSDAYQGILAAFLAQGGGHGHAALVDLSAKTIAEAGEGDPIPSWTGVRAVQDGLGGVVAARIENINGGPCVISAAPVENSRGGVFGALVAAYPLDLKFLKDNGLIEPTLGSVVVLGNDGALLVSSLGTISRELPKSDKWGQTLKLGRENFAVVSNAVVDDGGPAGRVVGLGLIDTKPGGAMADSLAILLGLMGLFAVAMVAVVIPLAPREHAEESLAGGLDDEEDDLRGGRSFPPDFGEFPDALKTMPPPNRVASEPPPHATPAPRLHASVEALEPLPPQQSPTPADRAHSPSANLAAALLAAPPLEPRPDSSRPGPAHHLATDLAGPPMAHNVATDVPTVPGARTNGEPLMNMHVQSPIPAASTGVTLGHGASPPPPAVARPAGPGRPAPGATPAPSLNAQRIPGSQADHAMPPPSAATLDAMVAAAMSSGSMGSTPPPAPGYAQYPGYPSQAPASPPPTPPATFPGLNTPSGSWVLPPETHPGYGAVNPLTPSQSVVPASPIPPPRADTGRESGIVAPFDETHYRVVYNDFIGSKRRLGEHVDNITFEGFSSKLRNSEKQLIDRHGCRAVRFQVQIKDNQVSLRPQLVR